jgi:hypothetical protein
MCEMKKSCKKNEERNCLLKHIIEGKIEGMLEVTGR